MPPSHDEQDDFENRNLLPPYIPPRRKDAPWVSVPIKGHATRVAPKITKGMAMLCDIMPQIQKLSFEAGEIYV